MGDSGPAVLNGANEVAVRAFLEGRLPFVDIVRLAAEVLRSHQPAKITLLEDALGWDRWGRERAGDKVMTGARSS